MLETLSVYDALGVSAMLETFGMLGTGNVKHAPRSGGPKFL
jgi:hypothetical protein